MPLRVATALFPLRANSSHPLMTAGSELGTVTSAVSMLTPLVAVKASGSPSLLVKLLATALTPG